MSIGTRRIVYRKLRDVVPAPRNPKRHDIEELTRSLARFGIIDPLVEDGRTGKLISGHGRLETLAAAEAAGLPAPEGVLDAGHGWRVPIVVGWRSRNRAEADAALVAVNHLTERGGWDTAELAAVLSSLPSLEGVGYDPPDLEQMLASLNPHPDRQVEPDRSDERPVAAPREPGRARTKRGDVWQLGPHRLLCGDCRDAGDVARALDGRRIAVAFTSPPYADRREYDPTTGFRPIPPEEYVDWFEPVAANVAAHLADDGSWFVNIKEHCEDGQRTLYVKDLTLAHVRAWGWLFVDELCWLRSGMPGGWNNRFKNAWEPVFHYCRQPSIKFRPYAVGVESDAVFDYSPNNLKSPTGSGLFGDPDPDGDGRGPGLARPSNVVTVHTGGFMLSGEHPAEFPVGLPSWFVRAYSDAGDVVFDPFAGSGSTLLAAYQLDRVGVAVELSPRYCDVICARWQDTTGERPVLERTGRAVSFAA